MKVKVAAARIHGGPRVVPVPKHAGRCRMRHTCSFIRIGILWIYDRLTLQHLLYNMCDKTQSTIIGRCNQF